MMQPRPDEVENALLTNIANLIKQITYLQLVNTKQAIALEEKDKIITDLLANKPNTRKSK